MQVPIISENRLLNQVQIGNTILAAVLGNIVLEQTDAVVNAANTHLWHGGGVAGAIAKAGGQRLLEESRAYVAAYGPVSTGAVGVTGPGNLPTKHVIHAVGPIYRRSPTEPDELFSAVLNSLQAAHNRSLSSIAIPAISSGIFGFPKEDCASLMVSAALMFIERCPTLQTIRFTNFDIATASIFEKTLERVQQGTFSRYEPMLLTPFQDPFLQQTNNNN